MHKYLLEYYRFPLFIREVPLPFKIPYQFGYCSILQPIDWDKDRMNFDIVGVLNHFSETEAAEELSKLKTPEFLFGRMLFTEFTKRGPDKWIKIGSEEITMTDDDLPVMAYTNSINLHEPEPEANWFYLEKGEYVAFNGKKTAYEKVGHLEHNNLVNGELIRLRTCIELIKLELKNRKIEWRIDQWKTASLNILKASSESKKRTDTELMETIDVYMFEYVQKPVFSTLPVDMREKYIK